MALSQVATGFVTMIVVIQLVQKFLTRMQRRICAFEDPAVNVQVEHQQDNDPIQPLNWRNIYQMSTWVNIMILSNLAMIYMGDSVNPDTYG